MVQGINEKMLLKDKVCIVTGAGGGIGSAICKQYAIEGAKVVIACEHNKGTVNIWKNKAGNIDNYDIIVPYVISIENEIEIKDLIQHVKKKYGKIDVLVNVAGVEYNEPIGLINYQHMEQMFNANIFGLIEMVQYTARVMMRQGGGSIINIASIVGVYGNPGQSVYSATKGAVISFTKSASKELAQFRIRVNALCPGLTDTKMIRQVSDSIIKSRLNNIGLGRMALPEDIAQASVFFASNKSDYITGQVLNIDGGTIM